MALFGLIPSGGAQIGTGMANSILGPRPTAAPTANVARPKSLSLPDLLGIKGGARDAIGHIGDALLIGTGNDPIYGPRVKQERVAEAMKGFDQDPQGAIERLGEIDPEYAMKVASDFATQQQKQAEEQRAALKGEIDRTNQADAMRARLLQGATPETYGAMRDRIINMGTKLGQNWASQLPPAYDEATIGNLINQGMSPDAYVDNKRADRNTESQIQRREAQTSYDEQRLGMQEDDMDSKINRRNVQNRNDSRRVEIAQQRADNPPAARGQRASKKAPAISGSLPASKVPSNARLGRDSSGRRVANVGGKIYYVD